MNPPVEIQPAAARGQRHVLITGGAGFIGTNLADRLLRAGNRVLILDDLSRGGVRQNAEWLEAEHGKRVTLEVADVRDVAAVRAATRHATSVFHFAAQVAVTSSLTDPEYDFDVNARGTLNVLNALRKLDDPPPLLFTSTNKVYGGLDDIGLVRGATRYEPQERETRAFGVGEARPLDFHSPYGCSKGAADQYVIDYARTYGLRAVVFRMSCIYGPHQFGNEDQGWVAHFLITAMRGEPITLYGDGLQVRDILYVEDLVDAMLAARDHVDELSGRAFNMGGGPSNTTSLVELMDQIARLDGARPDVRFGEWRPGDQRWYVSDTRAFQYATEWRARVGAKEGVRLLHRWLRENRGADRLEAVTVPVRKVATAGAA